MSSEKAASSLSSSAGVEKREGSGSFLRGVGERYGKNLLHGHGNSSQPILLKPAEPSKDVSNDVSTSGESEEEVEGGYWRMARNAVSDTMEGLLSFVPRSVGAGSEAAEQRDSFPTSSSSSNFGLGLFDKTFLAAEPTPPPSDSGSLSNTNTNTNSFSKMFQIPKGFKFQKWNPWVASSHYDDSISANNKAVRQLITLLNPNTSNTSNTSNHQLDSNADNDLFPLHNDLALTRSSSHDSNSLLLTYHSDKTGLISNAQAASRLAEGTIRTLRDLALDEAVELHDSLRFWNERWERPILGYLEAGPQVWFFSKQGYQHQHIGHKVSQIQAVLARRLAAIGDLQQHLIRAGWSRGVAQWGVLGQGGGQWAAVAGGDGLIQEEEQQHNQNNHHTTHTPIASNLTNTHDLFSNHDMALHQTILNTSIHHAPTVGATFTRALPQNANQEQPHSPTSSFMTEPNSQNKTTIPPPPPPDTPTAENNSNYNTPQRKKRNLKRTNIEHYTRASIVVHNARGGQISTNDPALAAWSVDAIRVVRDQLYRARNINDTPLPFVENWTTTASDYTTANIKPSLSANTTNHGLGLEMSSSFEEMHGESHPHDNIMPALPLWATQDVTPSDNDDTQHTTDDSEADNADTNENDGTLITPATENNNIIIISNLQLMTAEVEQLLNCMEVYMSDQRNRRSQKLKPPSRFARQWYVFAFGFPLGFYLVYKLTKKHGRTYLAKQVFDKARTIFAEHVEEPMKSIHRELFTRGEREQATDKKARKEAIESLKKMIKSWLDETFPQMPEDEKTSRATTMDMSLIEQTKEDSIKHIYNINNVVRMSLIEMQFIKKEMMNALISMDELMAANEMNMQVAAMTPAVVLLYGARYVFRKVYYALLKLGKSREETFGSFRHIILDIERLLVMRDNPPLAPPLLATTGGGKVKGAEQSSTANMTFPSGECVLNSDDLGMVMLLVHQCRKILHEDKRRFSHDTIRNVSEDLAELTGERGAVTVRQQLQILSRMCRTYPFLKVVSTGVPLNVRVD